MRFHRLAGAEALCEPDLWLPVIGLLLVVLLHPGNCLHAKCQDEKHKHYNP